MEETRQYSAVMGRAAALTGVWLFCGTVGASEQAALPELLPLPSGGVAHLHETLSDRPGPGLIYRFRFVQDGFEVTEGGFDAVMSDLQYLCDSYAVPRLPSVGPQPDQVVISLAGAETVFGEPTPGVAQVFEAFRVENGVCIWEEF
ncbi:DUF6497 family protein [Roseovarius nubinhibens]